MIYTGVGSRETPKFCGDIMFDLAAKLASMGYILRSGGATGADTFFENGCDSMSGKKEIYIPWNGFNTRFSNQESVYCSESFEEAEKIASTIHPAWNRLSFGAKKLHARNVYQVLGLSISNSSDFLVCYAKTDSNLTPIGGTRTAWVLAQESKIPCYNLFFEEDREIICSWLY